MSIARKTCPECGDEYWGVTSKGDECKTCLTPSIWDDRDKTALVLSFLQMGLSQRDIAKRTGISRHTIKRLLLQNDGPVVAAKPSDRTREVNIFFEYMNSLYHWAYEDRMPLGASRLDVARFYAIRRVSGPSA